MVCSSKLYQRVNDKNLYLVINIEVEIEIEEML